MSTFDYDKLIAKIPDYPAPGVLFRDVTPVFSDAQGLKHLVEDMAGHFEGRGVTKVLGAEARGFLIGAPVAYALGAGFVPARKPGKLPRETYAQDYELEYGTATLEVHTDALTASDKVLVIDDLIATGGTARAMVELVKTAGTELVGLGFFMELAGFDPRSVLAQSTDAEFFSILSVDSK